MSFYKSIFIIKCKLPEVFLMKMIVSLQISEATITQLLEISKNVLITYVDDEVHPLQ
jgi:hypothetical protein